MDQGVCPGFPTVERVSFSATHYVQTKVDEVLFTYVTMAPYMVSLVLILVDSGVQRPVYYVSKSVHKAEVCYLPLEKAILAMVHATCKLPYYF